MKKTLVILLVICCTTVAYATSVSVMIAAPKIATANSATMAPTNVSEILTVIYGEYSEAYSKSGVDHSTNALSASSQARGAYSNAANIEEYQATDKTGDDPASPTPVPEPNMLLLVGIGLAGLGLAFRLRR